MSIPKTEKAKLEAAEKAKLAKLHDDATDREEAERLMKVSDDVQEQIVALIAGPSFDKKLPRADRAESRRRAAGVSRHLLALREKRDNPHPAP